MILEIGLIGDIMLISWELPFFKHRKTVFIQWGKGTVTGDPYQHRSPYMSYLECDHNDHLNHEKKGLNIRFLHYSLCESRY